jgi:hypothetical protein
MSKDTGDSFFDMKGLGSLNKIEHPHYKRVDQINLFHPAQVKINLVERIPDLPQVTATKFAIKIKIFNLLFLLGPQHHNLLFL